MRVPSFLERLGPTSRRNSFVLRLTTRAMTGACRSLFATAPCDFLKKIGPYVWTAWVRNDAQKAAVEETLNRFVGHAITGCRYVEIDYEGGQEGWRGANRDELDYGLELDLDNGETWSIVWEQFDLNEGLNVRPGALVPESVRGEGAAIRDVSGRWLELGPGNTGRGEAGTIGDRCRARVRPSRKQGH